MNISQIIQQHAYLRARIARGVHTHQDTLTLQRLESQAQVAFSPQELAQAAHASSVLQAQLHRQTDVAEATMAANNRGFAGEKLSKQISGYSPDQYQAVLKGEAYPVRGNARQPKNARQKTEAFLSQLGVQWKYGKFNDFVSELEEKVSFRGEDAGKKLLKERFGEKANQMGDLISAFQEAGIAERVALTEDYAHEDEMVQPSERDQLRAQITDAWLHSEDRGQLAESEISEEYISSEHRHGDIARAMEAAERQQDDEERANWSAPTYDLGEVSNA